MDTSYQVRGSVNSTDVPEGLDMHEFHLINGETSLTIVANVQEVSISVLGLPSPTGLITQGGFRETDIRTGKVLFEWLPTDHISLKESMVAPPSNFGSSKIFGSARDIYDCL
jgi:hypothetical protein